MLWIEVLRKCLQHSTLGVGELLLLERTSKRFSRAIVEAAAYQYIVDHEKARGWGGTSMRVPAEHVRSSASATAPSHLCGAGALWLNCLGSEVPAPAAICEGRERWLAKALELQALDGYCVKYVASHQQVRRIARPLRFTSVPAVFGLQPGTHGGRSVYAAEHSPDLAVETRYGTAVVGSHPAMRSGVHYANFEVLGPIPQGAALGVGVVQANYDPHSRGIAASLTDEGWVWTSTGNVWSAAKPRYLSSACEYSQYTQGSRIGLQLNMDDGTLTAVRVDDPVATMVATLATGLHELSFARDGLKPEYRWCVEMEAVGCAVNIAIGAASLPAARSRALVC